VLTFFIFGLIYVKRKHKRIRILTWIHGGALPQAECWRNRSILWCSRLAVELYFLYRSINWCWWWMRQCSNSGWNIHLLVSSFWFFEFCETKLPTRVQCFKSFEQDFPPCSFLRWIIWSQGGNLDVCTSWYGVTMFFVCPAVWSEALIVEAGSILLSVRVLVDSGPSLCRIWELTNASSFVQSVSLGMVNKINLKSMTWVIRSS
jgi:hypothetical protein